MDGGNINLIKYITEQSRKPIPPELTKIHQDCSVVTYITNRGETRAAPTELCYPIYGTEDPSVRRLHRSTILSPADRQARISEYRNGYLDELRFGNIKVILQQEPSSIPRKLFTVPDCQFAASKILSVRGTANAVHVSLDNLGSERKALLKEVGLYDADLLDRQYFIIPESIYQSFGEQLLSDLKRVTNGFLRQSNAYNPIVVPYSDWGAKTPHSQGLEIVKAIKDRYEGPGYGLVMIHHLDSKKIREEDQLAALVIRELRKADIQIFAAVMHSAMGQDCYELSTSKDGNPHYRPRSDKRGKLS